MFCLEAATRARAALSAASTLEEVTATTGGVLPTAPEARLAVALCKTAEIRRHALDKLQVSTLAFR